MLLLDNFVLNVIIFYMDAYEFRYCRTRPIYSNTHTRYTIEVGYDCELPSALGEP